MAPIIADKDNKRVQVIALDGSFVRNIDVGAFTLIQEGFFGIGFSLFLTFSGCL